MASNENAGVDRLVTFGKMALEQGWYDQAREYFEQALALDASNQEAREALAEVEAILARQASLEPIEPEVEPASEEMQISHQEGRVHPEAQEETSPAVEPMQEEPVEPLPKVEQKWSIPEVTDSHDERFVGPGLRQYRDTSDAAGRPDAIAASVDRRIRYWEDRLHDMSRRNRLLFFRPTKASTAEIVHPSPTVLFDRLVVKGRTLVFPLPDEVASLGEDDREEASSPARRAYEENEIGAQQTDRQMLRILRNLRTRARTAREEKGVNVLYLAFGFLIWREGIEGELSKAPLVLVPVDLSREALGKPVQLSMLEEDIVVNPSLQIKLRQDFGLELPEVATDLDTVGLEEYWKQVDSLVNRHSGWKVLREVVLGIFGFQNLMIIADLKRNREALVGHPLIQALCSSDIPCPIPDVNLLEAGDLDDRVAPDRVFQVLDADSSQQEAIEAAKAGLSFVLQGPPGTGKSQTIANIIAEFLGKGRRVLFVSQKIAALEVVQRRLEQVGLGEFCLQIHSYRRDKREVVSELGHSLQIPTPSPPPQPKLQQILQELRTTRDKLNDYVRALHKPRFELGISAYHAYGQMARLAEVPQLRFVLPNLENVTPKMHQERLRIIAELTAYPQVIDQYGSHPWMGCRIKNLTLDMRSRLEEALLTLVRDIESFQERVGELAQVYAVSPPSTLQEGIELLRVAQIYGPEIMVAPVGAILRRYEKKYQSPLRYFRRNYWRDSALLRDLSDTGVRPDPRSILTVLEYATRLQARRVSDVEERVKTSRSSTDLHQLDGLTHQIVIAKELIFEQFEDDARPEVLANFYKVEWTTAVNWCQRQAKHIDKLSDWVNFNRTRQQGEAAGLSSFISRALDGELEAETWPEAFERGFYTLFLDAAIQSEPILRSFRSSTHDVLIEQFRELDKAQISLARRQIRARLMEQRPQASWMKAASAEETILRRELNKKRRLKPLRRLFSEIPDLILSLRPCLMMSPLTVSQLLDPELYDFDLVVFDEASQIPPEYAVASILRGKQVVIAGDRHQLPPTRFFEVVGSDAYEEEDLDEFESILNECDAAGMPSKMLLWHYRSRDESLIAFSNYHFYSRRLLTFPAADRQDSGTGLEFTYVPDGIYRRGKGARYNLIEARQVVQLILQHFRTDPELSLGVVAFSQAQRDTIEHELERALRDWPSLQPLIADTGDEPFFVKNLETVQGDERDVFFFSIGYGFDETGRFLMNFGPLNRVGGERRLNVAVTRARLRFKVIASIQPEDIDLSRTRSRGAQLLRSYMALARDGVQALYADMSVDPEAEFESPFEASVYEALTDRGLHLHKQVGVSGYRIDLAVVDSEQPGRYLLGIECDGAMYHSAATARDRDRLRQQVLEDLGWCMHRIWSRDWIENRSREIKKVLAAVERSRKREHSPAVRRAKLAPTSVDASSDNVPPPVVTRSVRKLPPEVRPYKKAILRRRGFGAASFHNASRWRHVEVMQEVVNSEGPIEISVAKRRVAEAWGIKRIGHKIDSKLDIAILAGEGKGVLKRRGGFLWPVGMKKAPVRVPQGDSGVRPVEQIAPEELSEAAYICVKAGRSLDEDDLIKQTAWLFGLHATSKAVKRIGMAIQPLIETGRLERRGGKIRLPRS